MFCDHALASAVAATAVGPINVGLSSHGASFATAINLGSPARMDEHPAVSSTDPALYYKITLSGPRRVELSLVHLTGDANLQLLSQQDQVLRTSAHPGAENESIGVTLAPGVYIIRVYRGASNASGILNIASLPIPPSDAQTASGLHIVFNYQYDSSGFFSSHPQAEALLNQAASAFSDFTNALTAIAPSGSNSWSESFVDPNGSGSVVSVKNPTVAADTVVIYVGGATNVVGNELGRAAPGGWSALGTQSWVDTVAARGQAGALATTPSGFGPWGGEITFSTTANWNLTTSLPTAAQNDFLSVATHEIAHVLGFGTAASWFNYVYNNKFYGPHAEALNHGLPLPLYTGDAHWADGTVSTANGVFQPAEMDPFLTIGTRRSLTALDEAALEDVGWTT